MDYGRYIARVLPLVISANDRDEPLEGYLPDYSERNAIVQTLNEMMDDARFLLAMRPEWVWVFWGGRMLTEFADSLPREYAVCGDREAYEELSRRIYPKKERFLDEFLRNILARVGATKGRKQEERPTLVDKCGNALKALERPPRDAHAPGEKRVESAEKSFQRTLQQFVRQVPPEIRDIAQRVGRRGKGRIRGHTEFQRAAACDIAGIETGDNLNALLPVETALLAAADTERLFYRRYVQKRLQTFSGHSVEVRPDRHTGSGGPVIICLDTSGSMAGEAALVAKVLTLAVAVIAQEQHRRVFVISFSDGIDTFELTDIGRQRRAVADFISASFGGGSDLSGALEFIASELLGRKEYANADVLTISDFELQPLGDEALDALEAAREADTRFFGLLIGERVGGMDFCDYGWQYWADRMRVITTTSCSGSTRG